MRVYEITAEYAHVFTDFVPQYVLKKIGSPGFHSVGQIVTDGKDYYSAGFLQYYDGELCERESARIIYMSVPEDERGKANAWALLQEMNRRLKSRGVKKAEIYLTGEQRDALQGYLLRRGYSADERGPQLIRTTFGEFKSQKLLSIPDSKLIRPMTEITEAEIARVLKLIPEEERAYVGIRTDRRLDKNTRALSLIYTDRENEGVLIASALPEGGSVVRMLKCSGDNAAKVSFMLIAKAVKRLDNKLPVDAPVYICNVRDRAVHFLERLKPDADVFEVWRGVKKI